MATVNTPKDTLATSEKLDTGGRRLGTNALWNLAGSCLPIVFILGAMPFIIDGLGTGRFGVLLLVWALIGYFGLVDLGIGPALAQMTARHLGTGKTDEVPSLVWSGVLATAGLGALGGLLLASTAGPLIRDLLAVPEEFQVEAIAALRLVALALPVIAAGNGLGGVLGAYQRFAVVNRLRIPLSAVNSLGQALVATLWPDLAVAAAVLVATRLLNAAALAWFCYRIVPLRGGVSPWNFAGIGALLRFGGWITISNVIGPLMVYLDRFVIGAMMSMSAVAYYATPQEAVIRLLVVPGAIMGVLFPAFATVLQQDRGRVARMFNRGLAASLLLVFPPTLLLVGFAEPLLGAWLGPDFAARSAPVLQILAVAVLLNSLTLVPYVFIQGSGRPDMTAKLHIAEILPYLLLLTWWTQMWGIVGAALVWALRVAVDGLVLAILARRLLPELAEDPRPMAAIGLFCGVLLFLLSLDLPMALQLATAAVGLAGVPLVIWRRLLTQEERQSLLAMLQARARRTGPA